MSTNFDIRNLRLPARSRTSTIVGAVVAVLAVVAAFLGLQVYRSLTNNHVVAYFSQTDALYAGDEVLIMGVEVGGVDKIEPAGDKMKVTFHYSSKYKVPANASAVILNPTLVAARTIQLDPPYRGGPVLGNHAVIPIERTQIPTEWDELRDSVSHLLDEFGPTRQQPAGPLGEVIESFADGLSGKSQQINGAFKNLSQALTALNEGRSDFFAVLRSLALFVNALHTDDQQITALNFNLAEFSGRLTHSDRDLANAIQQTNGLLDTLRPFITKNRDVLVHDIKNLDDVTTTLVQPDTLDGLETGLHVTPTAAVNLLNVYYPAHGALVANLALNNFANPMEFICSSIQAGSRLGYQDSAELCAEYLAPILDSIKFNYLPFGLNLFHTAATLPKEIAYSEPRLQPPNGYKDTTVPGIWVPDTPTSHRNTQHGWITGPGMQGIEVGPVTADLLTPESLAELMGGPDIAPVQSNLQTPPGPPNSYNEDAGPIPFVGVPGNPMPIGPPPPGPEVIPGPVAPTPAPGAGPAPAPDGPPLPAEAAISAGLGS